MPKHSKAAMQQAYWLIAASIRTTVEGMQQAGMLNTDIARAMLSEAIAYERKSNNTSLTTQRKVVHNVEQSIYVSPPERVD